MRNSKQHPGGDELARTSRALASAKPAGTPIIIASAVEMPAVMKLFSKARGKSDRVM